MDWLYPIIKISRYKPSVEFHPRLHDQVAVDIEHTLTGIHLLLELSRTSQTHQKHVGDMSHKQLQRTLQIITRVNTHLLVIFIISTVGLTEIQTGEK